MSVNLSKSPVWIVAVIVGLVVATALVAGYVDRPGPATQVAAAANGDCASCPLAGTEECPKETGTCPAGTGTCPKAACCAETAAATCPAGAAVMAQTDESTGATCPTKAAAASGCSGGQCPATQ